MVEDVTTAQLLVVQPGTQQNFRRRVIDAMRSLVPSSSAFFCFGTQDTRAYQDSTRVLDDAVTPLNAAPIMRVTQAFGFEAKSVVETTRRTYLSEELYPPADRDKLPYFSEHSVPQGLTRALLVFLHEGGVLFGVAGLERRDSEGAFTETDVARIEELSPFVAAAARSQIAYDELSREASALRALSKTNGTLYVIDRDRKVVLWAADRERGVDWEQDVAPIADYVVDAAEQSLASRARGDALPTPPRLPNGTVVEVAKIDGDPVFGAGRCAVLRVQPQETPGNALMETLSRREREIARLLVAGYSGVNVAAISGLSENTVRTYVRRLYGKLGVSNRADLVRKLVSPEPRTASPSSSIAPPADSSLAFGDDTLD